MSKPRIVTGLVLAMLGVGLLLTVSEPTRQELENPYGGGWGSLVQKVGGWSCIGIGVLILLSRPREPRHDPDLPPEYRV